MRSLMLIILSLFIVSACVPHYIPSTCPTVGNPPIMSKVQWVKICIVDSKTNNVTCWIAPASSIDLNKLKQNFQEKEIFITDCFEKIGQPDK